MLLTRWRCISDIQILNLVLVQIVFSFQYPLYHVGPCGIKVSTAWYPRGTLTSRCPGITKPEGIVTVDEVIYPIQTFC